MVVSSEIIRQAETLIGTADEGMVEDQFSPEPLGRYRQWSGFVCSRTINAGLYQQKRRYNLSWLERYIAGSYDWPARQELLRECREALTT